MATPAVRALARELGISLETVKGSGPSGSIIAEDLKKACVKARPPEGSAIANAVHVADKNQKRRIDEDDLYVKACYAGRGPALKRVRPAPMGRAYQVLKRTAHLTVHVAERES